MFRKFDSLLVARNQTSLYTKVYVPHTQFRKEYLDMQRQNSLYTEPQTKES